MKVCLISSDKRLERLCREVVSERAGMGYEWASGGAQAPAAELYLLDEDLSSQPRGGEVVYLARPEQVAALHQRLGEPLAVLVKPVKRPALERVLERAVARRQRAGPARDGRRAERDELLECLLVASFRLQQHSLDRTNFLARALHDFRAPLTAANGYCGLLLEQSFGALNNEQMETLRRMQHSLLRVSRMANTMFQLSLGRLVQDTPQLEPGDIVASIEQAVYEITPTAEAREIQVSTEVSRPQQELLIDRSEMEQVLLNLLENACKFTPRNGVIEVRGYAVSWPFGEFRVRAADGTSYAPAPEGLNAYRVDVHDSGPGVPAEEAHRIFEQSVRYGGSQDRSGTGLGLATCRLIVTAHHGEVFADTGHEGATFSFVLPFLHADGSAPAATQALAGEWPAIASSPRW